MTNQRPRTTRLWEAVQRQLRYGRGIMRTFKFLKYQRDWRRALVRANRVRKKRLARKERPQWRSAA